MSQNPFEALGGGGFDMNALLQQARAMLHDRFGIEHCTLQIERSEFEERCC